MSCAHAPPPLHVCPQTLVTWLTHAESQLVEQQKVSTEQICVTHGSQPLTRAPPSSHGSWAQLEAHGPQSAAHEEHVSFASQLPSPQVGGHAPQSAAQDVHVSPASQTPSPHPGPAPVPVPVPVLVPVPVPVPVPVADPVPVPVPVADPVSFAPPSPSPPPSPP